MTKSKFQNSKDSGGDCILGLGVSTRTPDFRPWTLWDTILYAAPTLQVLLSAQRLSTNARSLPPGEVAGTLAWTAPEVTQTVTGYKIYLSEAPRHFLARNPFGVWARGGVRAEKRSLRGFGLD